MDPTVRITAQKTFYLLGTGEISEIGFRVHFVKRRARTSPGLEYFLFCHWLAPELELI